LSSGTVVSIARGCRQQDAPFHVADYWEEVEGAGAAGGSSTGAAKYRSAHARCQKL